MTTAPERALGLLATLYDAAIDEACWQPFMLALRDEFGARETSVFELWAGGGTLVATASPPNQWTQAYFDHVQTLDPTFTPELMRASPCATRA